MAKANKAEKYLHKPELTNLITAQAAEMAGDRKQAETVYKRLLADERTRFVGIRGIMKQKLDNGISGWMRLSLGVAAAALIAVFPTWAERWMHQLVNEMLRLKLEQNPEVRALLPALEADVASRQTTAYAAARRIIELL